MLYDVADLKSIRNEEHYNAGKTEYFAKIEARDRFAIFVHPWRFGMSNFADMPQSYCDHNEAANFEKPVGGLLIGGHLTSNGNKYLSLVLVLSNAGIVSFETFTHGVSFCRTWFKQCKGSADRILMKGVLPETMDGLTSGFSIATNISQDEDFNTMCGFTEEETPQIFSDFHGVGTYVSDAPDAVVRTFNFWYGGYCFATDETLRLPLHQFKGAELVCFEDISKT